MSDVRDESPDTVVKAASTAAAATDPSLVVALSPNSNGVKLTPQTSGGLSMYSASTGATATSAKSSPGQLYGWFIYNSNSSVAYVQFFDLATGSVTLGTTSPKFSIGIPAGSGANVFSDTGLAFATAITYACTTTRSGSTAPTNTVDVNFFYS